MPSEMSGRPRSRRRRLRRRQRGGKPLTRQTDGANLDVKLDAILFDLSGEKRFEKYGFVNWGG